MAQKQVVFDKGPLGGGTCFTDPIHVIRADTMQDVANALAKIADALDAGFWLAGYFSYELGYGFTGKLADATPLGRSMPLINIGIFREPIKTGTPKPKTKPVSVSSWKPAWDVAMYREKFAIVHRYIQAGDAYQVNLTFPMRAHSDGSAIALYYAFADRQPVDFGAFVDIGGPVVLSRSPELFFQVDRIGNIETRPMKGTVRRGNSPQEDATLKTWLADSEKNRAENLMIVDLLRNDISKVCEIGTVKVPRAFTIESYTTVHQMTSTVRGQLRSDVKLPDILRALFPCGSVTGAPKVRAMQIISEIEQTPRDLYCGSVGWAAPDGRMEFNVAIRTVMAEKNGDLRLNVGGGIVYDSTADEEYEEALLKAQFSKIAI